MWMAELRRETDLLLEPSETDLQLGRQHLRHDLSAELRIVADEHPGHPAAFQLTVDHIGWREGCGGIEAGMRGIGNVARPKKLEHVEPLGRVIVGVEQMREHRGVWVVRVEASDTGRTLVVVLSTNGPGSMIGFDFARTENPAERIGSASGVVNVGGFVASLCTILAIGAVLDLLTPGSSTAYGLDAFRAAFAVQYVFWAIGLAGVARHRRQLRARLAGDGVVLAPLHRAVGARLRGSSIYT